MKCEKCGVTIAGAPARCPLCQGTLTGSPDPAGEPFPEVKRVLRTTRRFLSIVAFISVVAVVVCVLINVAFPSGGFWSLFVLAGIISFWLAFSFVLAKRGNIAKTIVYQLVVLSVIAFFWDLFTGFSLWSVDFVIPILCVCAMVALAVIAKIMNLSVNEYLIHLVIVSILGFVSLLLVLLGIPNVLLPSFLCIAASIISLAALIIFEGRALRSEIIRRMHL